MGCPIIQSLRNDMAALLKAGVIGQETLRAFDAPLALQVIADWIAFYNPKRPHQALKMMAPDEACAATLTA